MEIIGASILVSVIQNAKSFKDYVAKAYPFTNRNDSFCKRQL